MPFDHLSALPIVRIAPYTRDHDPHGRMSTSASLHAACVDYGFFYLDLTGFCDPSEPEELSQLARQFFALPQEEKDKLALRNQDGARGYARLKENVTNGKADNHEGLDIYRPVDNPDKTKTLWGENQWPTIPGFREKYELWIEKMKVLGMLVMEAMAVGLGMSPEEWEELRSQVDDSFWYMRVIGYPPLPNDQDGFSCGAHKDYGLLTFLWADATRGALQVFVRQPGLLVKDDARLPNERVQDGVWINADPIPGCIVCNIGEMWETWTNGLYKSALHRVVHRGQSYRVSIPFFYEPNFTTVVKPLRAALELQQGTRMPGLDSKYKTQQEDDAKIYEPVVYSDFLLKKISGNFETGKGKYD